MKYTFSLLFIFYSLCGFSQANVQPLGTPTTKIIQRGTFLNDSGFAVPKDTTWRSNWGDANPFLSEKGNALYMRRYGGWLGAQKWFRIGPYYNGYGLNLNAGGTFSADTTPGNLATQIYVDTAQGTENILKYGADPTGVIDATASINAAFARAAITHKPVIIPQGTFNVTDTSGVGAIVITAIGQKVYGTGPNSVIKCTSGRAFSIKDTYGVTIEGIKIEGSLADSTNTGIYIRQSYYCTIRNCFFYRIGGRMTDGGTISAPAGGGAIYMRSTDAIRVGNIITGNYFREDSVGINWAYLAEYNAASSNKYYACGTAVVNWSGNNHFVNETITNGKDGYLMLGDPALGIGSNPGHGSVTGSEIAHMTGRAIVCKDMYSLGFQFNGITAAIGSIVIDNCTNVQFSGGWFHTITWTLTNSYNTTLTNPVWYTGSDPNVTVVSGESIRTIYAPNLLTLTDGATIAWNVLYGKTAKVSLGATGRTLSISNAVSGDIYRIFIFQDGTGSRTITTWPTGTVWVNGSAPTLKTAASAVDIIEFRYDGTSFYARPVADDVTTKADKYVSFNAQTGTTYTLVLSDDSKRVSMNNASANTLTVPPNSSVAFPVGTQIIIKQKGAGQTTIAAGVGVTINSADGALKLRIQYSSAVLTKSATDTWELEGDITN